MLESRVLYTYALIKSLYDKGGDYVDSFWPFVIKVIPGNEYVDTDCIRHHLEIQSGLRMPLYVLDTILKRARRKGYLDRKSKKYLLTEKGEDYLEHLETEKDVERRINSLLNDILVFFRKRDLYLSIPEIKGILFNFVQKNIEPLINYLSPQSDIMLLTSLSRDHYIELLIQYIQEAEHSKPSQFKTFKEIVLGSLISTILFVEKDKYSDINRIRTEKFKDCEVYLDSNFIFSLLGLHEEEFNKPAQELFELLKKFNFNIKVFEFTIEEMCKVIRGYLTEQHKYPCTVHVDVIYSNLKRKGWSKADVYEFISNIEYKLEEKGISMVRTPDIDLRIYKPADESLRKLMEIYKPEQPIFHQNHDLAAIEKIKSIRKRNVRKIEEAGAFFLTSDYKLSKFNLEEMGHRDKGTICEVIPDRLLTNVLWLKNPEVNLSLNSIIAAHSQGLFVRKRVWDKFYEIVKKLRMEKRVDDGDISVLFYHGYIEDVLREIEEDEASVITEDFVVEKIEEASKLMEQKAQEKINKKTSEIAEKLKLEMLQKEKEFIKKLNYEISKKEQEKEQEIVERLMEIKNNLKASAAKEAQKRAKKIAILSAAVLTAILLTLIVLVILYLPPIVFKILMIVIPSGAIGGVWTKCRKYIEDRLSSCFFNKLFKQKLTEAGLNHNEIA